MHPVVFRDALKIVTLLKSESMQTTIIREKLHQLIDELEDKKAEAIYTLLAEEQHTELQRRKLILSERERYLKGEAFPIARTK